MVTVGEILKLPYFSGCTVMAGLSGLDRSVRGWKVAERADVHLWIKGGEFVMSMLSFAANPHSEEVVAAWVNSLIGSGISALGIKRAVYCGKPPQFLLELGDRNSIPVIEMDDGLYPSEAGEMIFSRIIASRTENLKKALDFFSEMTTATVESSIPGLTRQLSLTLGNPILLETPNMCLAGVGGGHTNREKRILAARREPNCVAGIAKKLCDDDAYEIIPELGLRFVKHEFAAWGETFRQLTFPVEVSGSLYGYVSVIEADKELDNDDHTIVRLAINAITLIIRHDDAYLIEGEARQKLFEAMIDPRREKEAEERAMLCDFDCLTPAFCVTVRFSRPEERNHFPSEALLTKLLDETRDVDQGALVICADWSIVVFCHVLDASSAKKQKIVRIGYQERLKYILGLFENLKNVPGLRFGVGHPGSGVTQLRASFEGAQDSMRIAERFGLPRTALIGQAPIVKYYSILDALLQDERKARIFCNDVLGPLLQSKIKRKDAYCDTLEAYLQHGKNLSEISRHTGLHRNTVIYRIEKIREILGADQNDFQADLSVWLALQIRKYLADGLAGA